MFIDRDLKTFLNLISYLQTGSLPIFKTISAEKSFFNELHFWGIPLPRQIYKFKFDKLWCADNIKIEPSGRSLKKQSPTHGLVFVTPTMNATNSFIEFKVIMNIPCKNKSHLYIGLVDKSKYKKQYLYSNFWKECPSSFYWDVWNKQLIKTDETGDLFLTKKGYGCEYEDYETRLALEYNQENRTLRFYKNDIKFEVAFHNVPPNMTPALDIRFESGSIEITNASNPADKLFL
ncbi:MAG: hypothetical protein MJ252_28800 [archaeon]|nr:hypothetical protein [archaeon]